MPRSKDEWMGVVNRNLRAIIERSGLSSEELSKRSGIHMATISQLRNNQGLNPQLSTLVAVAHAAGADLNDLFAVKAGESAATGFETFSHRVAATFWKLMGEFGINEGMKEMEGRYSAFFDAVMDNVEDGMSKKDKAKLYWLDAIQRKRGEA